MKYEFKVELRKTNSRKRKPEQNSKAKPKISREKKQLILAHQISQYMDKNNVSTLHAVSKFTNTSVARLSQIMNLIFLPPKAQETILFKEIKNKEPRRQESFWVPTEKRL